MQQLVLLCPGRDVLADTAKREYDEQVDAETEVNATALQNTARADDLT